MQISALILARIREVAENHLRNPLSVQPLRIYQAVLTVPAKFNQAQRMGTLEAAKQAGFTDVHLITEPSAGNAVCDI